jgi:kynurenine formamidase
MEVYDLTHTISEDMPVYPGTEQPQLLPGSTYEKDGFRETILHMFSHTGTHMDAPNHLFPEQPTLDRLPIDQFVGSALVIDCRTCGEGDTIPLSAITAYGKLADEADFLLFCTGWDRYWGKPTYYGAYPYLSSEAVEYLKSHPKKGVGLDMIGIDPIPDENLTIHRQLLASGNFVIMENLVGLDRLLGKGLFTYCALPTKFENADGAPIRVIAIA